MKTVMLMVTAAMAAGLAEAQWARPDLVEKVARGELAEAEVSWWGYDGADSTPYIQAALSSKARKVTLDRRDGPWFARPLWGRSDLTLVVPQGVELCAKRGEFRRQADFLLRFNSATNVTLTGGGTIRMWFEDYTNKALYAWSEWRHAVAFLSCHRVLVENLRIADSGGDGIYLGKQGRIPANTDVTIRNVTLSRHNRQGISVITADRLLIEDCVMENTCGTPPMAGIDFEPNGTAEMLRDIVVRRCTVRGNHGAGFDFSVGNLNSSSPPISILLEDCSSVGNHNPTKFHRGLNALGGFRGAVTFRRCTFDDRDGKRDTFRSEAGAETMSVTFEDCRAADPEKGGAITPLGPGYGWPQIRIPSWPDGAAVVAGSPCFPDLSRVVVHDSAPGVPVRLARVRLRAAVHCFAYADCARTVRIKGVVQRVGRSDFKSCNVAVYSEDGRTVARLKGPAAFGVEHEMAFNAPGRGFYRIDVRIGNHHAMCLTEADAPVALVDWDGLPGWSGLPGEVHLRVPEGCGRLALAASGGGGNELVHVKLYDPSGACVWDVDDVGPTRIWFAPERPAAGLWRLVSLKASKGCMDDYSFGVYGIPCRMFLSPEKTWEEPVEKTAKERR